MENEYVLSYDCNDCNMKFESAKQLANHVKKFCVYSGYNNLEGLIQKQQRNVKYDKVDLDRSNLKDYGHLALGKLKSQINPEQRNNLTENALRNKQDQLIQDLLKFQKNNQTLQNYQYNYSKNRTQLDKKVTFQQSRVQQDYKNISPSSDPQNAKIQKALKNMTDQQRWQYAENKIRELQDIKQSYIQNGGNDVYFLSHLNGLYKFYTQLKDRKGTQIRLTTPIGKLKQFENTKQAVKQQPKQYYEQTRKKTSNVNRRSNIQENQTTLKNRLNYSRQYQNIANQQKQKKYPNSVNGNYQNNNPSYFDNRYPTNIQYVPFPVYPPYPMTNQMPNMKKNYYQQNQYQTPKKIQKNMVNAQNLNYLQKLLEIKDDENKKLLELLQKKKQQPFQESIVRNPPSRNQRVSSFKNTQKQDLKNTLVMNQINNKNLLPQQRVLISLQKQELDELRLLSVLPQDLQKLKLQTIKNMTELRTKIQKQVQQQRLQRMKYQMQKQLQDQQRLYQNQVWVDNQRKKELSQKIIGELQ